MKSSTITLTVNLDENQIPETINWSATDGGIDHQESKAILLSVWDPQQKETLKIDLWTKDMPLNDMKVFIYQTLVSMSETYRKATNDEKMTQTMLDFTDYFAEKMELQK